MAASLEHHAPREEDERTGAVQPVEDKAQGDLTSVYKYPRGLNEEDEDRFCLEVHSERVRTKEHK